MKRSNPKAAWLRVYELTTALSQRSDSFELRQRFNPHHSSKDKEYEERGFRELQLADWKELKETYIEHREAISLFIHDEEHSVGAQVDLWKTLENVLNQEATDALEDMITSK